MASVVFKWWWTTSVRQNFMIDLVHVDKARQGAKAPVFSIDRETAVTSALE
ncbi:MAG: hypothetical protein IPO87_18285 [Flavobacteriales bacterium]|nr:hypothetical protein [Flavobacteriales bacterium]